MSDMALAGVAQSNIAGATATQASYKRGFVADVLYGVEAYTSMQADWQRLAALQKTTILVQSPSMLKAWAKHFGGGAESLVTVVVRSANNAVLIWPLCVERRGLLKIAAGAGSPIAQYDELLLDPDCDAKQLIGVAIDALKRSVNPDVISLERVRGDSALRSSLSDTQPLSSNEGAPYADLSDGLEGFWSTRKPRVRRQQKKRVRSLDKKGNVEFRVSSDPADAGAWISEALALKRGWLRSTGRISRAFAKRETGDCLVEMAQSLADAEAGPRMVISRLTLDGRTAAIEAGFSHRGAYHLYLGAYAPDCAKLGPGNVLTEKVLEWCIANGITRYDMLAPRSRNKREWQTGDVAIFDYALPMTLRGRLYVALVMKRLAPALRDAFYALPASIRSKLAGITLRI